MWQLQKQNWGWLSYKMGAAELAVQVEGRVLQSRCPRALPEELSQILTV